MVGAREGRFEQRIVPQPEVLSLARSDGTSLALRAQNLLFGVLYSRSHLWIRSRTFDVRLGPTPHVLCCEGHSVYGVKWRRASIYTCPIIISAALSALANTVDWIWDGVWSQAGEKKNSGHGAHVSGKVQWHDAGVHNSEVLFECCTLVWWVHHSEV